MNAQNLVFKLVVLEGDKELYSNVLGYEMVSNIASQYRDTADNVDFFAVAAKHLSSSVRESIANKDNISEDTCNALSNDTSIEVLRKLVTSSAFKEYATEEVIEKLIKLDFEIAQNVANNIEDYQQADINKLATLLRNHTDPSVANSLANNYNTPKKILKLLATHLDPDVAFEAKRQLED